MSIYLNQKEQVFDLKLTSYGKYLISMGNLKPVYYAFFDDNILYDYNYSRPSGSATGPSPGYSGTAEPQYDTRKRIQEESQYLESMVLFEDVEGTSLTLAQTYDDISENYNVDLSPQMIEPRKDMYVYEAMIGDAHFTAENKQFAPAWKIVTLDGEINQISSYDQQNQSHIPFINITASYKRKTVHAQNYYTVQEDYRNRFGRIAAWDSDEPIGPFSDNRYIVVEPHNLLVYIEELNTEFFTENFEVELFEVVQNTAQKASGSYEIYDSGSSAAHTALFLANLNGKEIQLKDGTSKRTLTLKTTPSADWLTNPTNFEVEIGSTAALTADNLDKKIDSGILNLNLDSQYIWTSDKSGSVLVTNDRYGVGGNVDLTASAVTLAGGINIHGMAGGQDGREVLQRRYFSNDDKNNVVDGYIVEREEANVLTTLTTASVDYYFRPFFDGDVNNVVACNGRELYSKNPYYIDFDLSCEGPAGAEYNPNIYFKVTEPDICQD